MRRRSELMQLLIGMSISRYLAPIGTAGLLRASVSGNSRVPRPPPRMTAMTWFMMPLPGDWSRLDSDTFDTLVAVDEIASRPGAMRRAGAGAWHVAAGFAFLLRRPSLWPLAVLPTLLMVVCLASGALFAV